MRAAAVRVRAQATGAREVAAKAMPSGQRWREGAGCGGGGKAEGGDGQGEDDGENVGGGGCDGGGGHGGAEGRGGDGERFRQTRLGAPPEGNAKKSLEAAVA